MEQNNKTKQYTAEVEKLEVSKLDASSNYKKAEEFMLEVIRDEQIKKEDKIEIGKQVSEHLLLTEEQKDQLSKFSEKEYNKTQQSRDEYAKQLLEEMADDSEFIYKLVPYMDYTKEHGLSYMALKKYKDGKLENVFVSSKKDIVPYKDCEQVGIYLKHQRNKSDFSLRSYLDFFQDEDNITAGNIFKTLKEQLQKYIIFPNEELYDVVALWIMHTYVYCIFRYVPYIWLNADAGSGKSTVMDVILQYVFNGKTNVGSTAAATFRLIEQVGAVLGLDEFEDMNGEEKSLLLTILKVGFKAGATVTRCSSENNYEPVEYSAFSPKIFAGITEIDSVLLTRCIKINMQMSKDTSEIEDFNNNDFELKGESAKIRNDLHIFGLKYIDKIYQLYKDKDLFTLDKNYTPREKDLWKPLVAISRIVDEEANATTKDSIYKYSRILHEELEKTKYTEVKPRLLHFLTEYIKDRNDLIFVDWYPIGELLWDLKETGDFSEIKSSESLGKYLSGFGFEKELKTIPASDLTARSKKKTGYYITKKKLDEVKRKLGLDMI